MSEFKFACPVCGQHITADSKASGTQLECPTCFRAIVVPQAPASGDSKLILSATQAATPRPIPPELRAPAPFRKSGSRHSLYLIGLCLFALCASTSAFLRWRGEVLINALHKPDPPVQQPPAVYPVPTSTTWTMDLARAVIPEGPVVGRVHGQGFFCERAILRGGLLSLRQGKIWPPDLGISVRLFVQQGEDLSGKTIVVRPDRHPPLPEVALRWKDEQKQPMVDRLESGYALQLVFGDAENGKMPGRIFIALPDGSQSFVAGTFEAVIRKPLPPKKP
ncbi:MAG: hypothetical protein ACREIC_27325 [Limisphaerales bacterium]